MIRRNIRQEEQPEMRNVTVTFLLLALCATPALAGPCDAYFPFDGNLADASGNGYHGLPIVKEGEPGGPQFTEGKIGQALHLTGGSAVRTFVDLHYDFCPQVTITAWFKLVSVEASGDQYIFSTGSGHGPGMRAQKSTIRLAGTGNGISQQDAIRDRNTWFFVAAVYDYAAGTYKLHWRNRVVEGKFADSRRPPEDSFWIGTFNDSLSYMAQDLYIDELRIQGNALTDDELLAVAEETSPSAGMVGPAGSQPALSTNPLPTANTDAAMLTGVAPLRPAEFIGGEEGGRRHTLEQIVTDMRQQGRISPEAETELIQRIRDVYSRN